MSQNPHEFHQVGNNYFCGWLPCFSEKAVAPHSSVLAWRIPGTVEPGGLPSVGLHRVRQGWSDLAATAMFLFCFLLTLSFSFILFLLCLDKEAIHSYLRYQMFLLVFCYSFPITHSDYFTPLLEVHQRHPNGLRKKFEILIIAKEVLQDLTRAFLSDCASHHPYCSFPLLVVRGTSLCALDKHHASDPLSFLLWLSQPFLWSADSIISSVKKVSLALLRKVSFGYRFSHFPDHILLKNNNYCYFLYLRISPIRTCW